MDWFSWILNRNDKDFSRVLALIFFFTNIILCFFAAGLMTYLVLIK